MPKTPKNFYIFRHGECPLNVSGRIQGQTFDGELTEKGRAQARRAGRKLQNKNIEIIVSSPMKRARQTAAIVASYVKAPIVFDDRLKEVNMGIVEGLHISEVETKYKDIYLKWRNCSLEDTTTRFENGETKAEVRQRILEVLNHYAEETDYICIGISGHGITISQTLLSLGIRKYDIPNGSVMHLTYRGHNWNYNGFVED